MKIAINFRGNSNKIFLIKLVRSLNGMGLKDAKELICDNGLSKGKTKVIVECRQGLAHANKMLADIGKYGMEGITVSGIDRKNKKTKEGSHVFEFPNDHHSELIIEDLRTTLNTKRYKLKVEKNGDWIGVKIHKAKGVKTS
tara:strand:- start:440 stop:862 length:423 start_codon:yes stop_codon:yes gene_type:complete